MLYLSSAPISTVSYLSVHSPPQEKTQISKIYFLHSKAHLSPKELSYHVSKS